MGLGVVRESEIGLGVVRVINFTLKKKVASLHLVFSGKHTYPTAVGLLTHCNGHVRLPSVHVEYMLGRW